MHSDVVLPQQKGSKVEDAARCLAEFGIIPVVEVRDPGQAQPMFEALIAGGLPVAEITLRTTAGLDAIALLARAYPDSFIGAGTVRNAHDAARVIDAGARFVVSPGLDREVVKACVERETLVMPGVCTPTEVMSALNSGAALLKFFPAEASGGIAFLKALAGPFAEVRFVPTGGINPGNLGAYLALPQVTACGGSWMVSPELLAQGSFDAVSALAAEAVELVAQARRHD